jgi:hypothetical protein
MPAAMEKTMKRTETEYLIVLMGIGFVILIREKNGLDTFCSLKMTNCNYFSSNTTILRVTQCETGVPSGSVFLPVNPKVIWYTPATG